MQQQHTHTTFILRSNKKELYTKKEKKLLKQMKQKNVHFIYVIEG